MNRRSFLTACIATCTAPAIVRASSLMPVKARPFSATQLVPGVINDLALLNGTVIIINGGTGMGQARTIANYQRRADGGDFIVHPPWSIAPDMTSTYSLYNVDLTLRGSP